MKYAPGAWEYLVKKLENSRTEKPGVVLNSHLTYIKGSSPLALSSIEKYLIHSLSKDIITTTQKFYLRFIFITDKLHERQKTVWISGNDIVEWLMSQLKENNNISCFSISLKTVSGLHWHDKIYICL